MKNNFIKVYLYDEDDVRRIEELADKAHLSVSAYVRSRLPLPPPESSTFQQALEQVIELAEKHVKENPNETGFSIPELFTPIAWRELTGRINAGLLGRRFYESVQNGKVYGVAANPVEQKKQKRATYRAKASP